ncbi:phosphate ABC transporter ATP-binding protein, partial [Mycoplasma putrefaciens]
MNSTIDETKIYSKSNKKEKQTVIKIKNFNFYYNRGKKQSLFDINMDIKERTITTFIGPSGCGKTTLLKSLNRMNDLIDGTKITGLISIFGQDIYDLNTDITKLRTQVGMVFQKPNPFPISIYENVIYGPKSQGIKDKAILQQICQESLQKAALW